MKTPTGHPGSFPGMNQLHAVSINRTSKQIDTMSAVSKYNYYVHFCALLSGNLPESSVLGSWLYKHISTVDLRSKSERLGGT